MSSSRNILLSVCVGLCIVEVSAFVGCNGDDSQSNPSSDAAADTFEAPDTATPSEAAPPADTGPDAPTGPGLVSGQVDRLGRAAIIEALIPSDQKLKDLGIDASGHKNAYNYDDSLLLVGLGSLPSPTISADFQRSLVGLDLMDGVDNWDGGNPNGQTVQVPIDAGPDADGGFSTVQVFSHPLVSVLKTDLIWVDASKPFSATGYLEIEYNTLIAGTPGAQVSCGGRWMNDDAVDKTLSFIVAKSLTGVSDHVDSATKPSTTTFPFLAPPN